jgi:DNA polymerase-3 subunit epsilon
MFLQSEFHRCGLAMPPVPFLCTMRLANYHLRDLARRTLEACCAAAGVLLTDHHSALHDARAAAGLFARYRHAHRELPPPWLEALLVAARLPAAHMQAVRGFQPVTRAIQQERRAGQRSPLADLVDDLPAGISGDNDAYLSWKTASSPQARPNSSPAWRPSSD